MVNYGCENMQKTDIYIYIRIYIYIYIYTFKKTFLSSNLIFFVSRYPVSIELDQLIISYIDYIYLKHILR